MQKHKKNLLKIQFSATMEAINLCMNFFRLSHYHTTLVLLSFVALLLGVQFAESAFAQVAIPGEQHIRPVSIQAESLSEPKITINIARDNIGLKLLSFARMIISGFALIYMVLMGVYMVIYSDDEGETTKQKRQLTNVLVAFLFLNIPAVIYNIFL